MANVPRPAADRSMSAGHDSPPSRRGSTGSSPLTDPVVQDYRSGLLRYDSPRRPKVV
jgi:hypothetical protein